MVYNPVSKQPENVWDNTSNGQKAKILNKEIVHLRQICKITEETT